MQDGPQEDTQDVQIDAQPAQASDNSQETAPQSGETQQEYIDRTTLDKTYQAMQSHVDKQYSQVNEQMTQQSQILTSLQPLANLLTQQQQQQPDSVSQDPLGVLRNLEEKMNNSAQENEQLNETVNQMRELITNMQSSQIGQMKSNQIDAEFADRFSDNETLQKAKALAGGPHQTLFAALYNQNEGDVVKSFDQYLVFLKGGAFNDQSQDVSDVVNALNRDKQQAQLNGMSGFSNPRGGGVQGRQGQNQNSLLDMGSMTFGL